MRLTYRIVLLLAVGVCMGYGCSRTHTGAEGEKANVAKKGKPAKTSVLTGMALPEGFPKDVPLYPKATVVTATTVKDTMTATLKTADSIKMVEAYYKGRLKKNGWKIAGRIDKHENVTSFAKKESHNLTMVISGESGQTMIRLTVTDEK